MVRDQLTGRGVECLLPLCKRVSQWKDWRKQIEWPLFSGYCFGRFDLEQRMQVLQAPGVVQIIGSAHAAEPIPADEIAAIQHLMQSDSDYETYPYFLEEGMMVTVIRGPLQGLHGKFMRKASTCRLIIAVNLIQQAAAVEINANDVAVVNDHTLLTSPSYTFNVPA